MAAFAKPARVVSQSLLRLQTDTRLAQLARDGHEPAFNTLVERYRAELVRASSRIVGPDRSEDAVQQALLNAHRAIDTTENVQNLRAWLHKITQNSSLNTLRALRDEVPVNDEHNLASRTAGPADAAELSERLRETLAAIDQLPEHQRAALLLREFEGRSHDDIAATLGLSAGAARQQLMRARQGVRRAVTALTPYPLIAALATPSSNTGIAELVFGAGASATAVKFGASVAATGAVASGVFGASVALETKTTKASQVRTTTTTTSQPVSQAPGATAAGAISTADDHSGKDEDGSGADNGGSGKGNDGSGENSSGSGKGQANGKTDNSGPGKSREDRQRSNEDDRTSPSSAKSARAKSASAKWASGSDDSSKAGKSPSGSIGSGSSVSSDSDDSDASSGNARSGSGGAPGNSGHGGDD